MLRINVPSTPGANIARDIFDEYGFPKSPNGTETEVNGDLVLLFEDEEQAVAYLDELEDYAADMDNDSPAKPAINELITAVNNDEFVQAYLK